MEKFVRAALVGLALKYRYVTEQLEKLVGHYFGSIYIVGGGSKDELLCQLTANCCKRTVYAGPVKATALGNALTQLISLGELSNLQEAKSLVKRCFQPVQYHQRDGDIWDEHYQIFLKTTKFDVLS
ncbi:MAG TPA: FGGY-family carbohydrate kinase [Ruminiclostridium sp.]